MPERNDEMSLREALVNAMSAEPMIEDGVPAENPDDEGVPGEGAPTEAQIPVESAEPPVGDPVPQVQEPSLANGAAAAVNQQSMPSSAEMWQAFTQLIEENKRLNQVVQQREMQFNQQISQQNAAMHEQSQAAERAIMGQFTPEAAMPKASPNPASPPALNLSEISYLSPDEQQVKLAEWQQEAMNYAIRTAAAQIRDEVNREIAPVKEDYEAKRRIAENNAAMTALTKMPQFEDMKGKEGDLDKIIAGTPLLQGANPEQRYVLAALISRGMNASRQPTTEELIEKALANPDVMKALETRRVAEVQQNNGTLPKVVPSSGIGNANAVPEERPKTSEDVRNLMLSRLGIRK